MVAPRSADAASMRAAPKVAPSSADDPSLRAGSKKTLVAPQIRLPIPAGVEVEAGHAYPGGTAAAGSSVVRGVDLVTSIVRREKEQGDGGGEGGNGEEEEEDEAAKGFGDLLTADAGDGELMVEVAQVASTSQCGSGGSVTDGELR
uniref:Uncharacterized protein n=1 Tax=Oryza punctata TaxID=4537 RepID=A0A0E0LD09_ORYPU